VQALNKKLKMSEALCFDEGVLRFHHPFTLLISGPTSSGKSTITFRIIKHRFEMISEPLKKVLYCLPEGQTIKLPDFISHDENVEFHQGLPDMEQLSTNKTTSNGFLLILDDLMSETDGNIMNLFCRQSHHMNISVIFLVQNLFFGGNKFYRSISLNSHYIILTKNPREKKQISILSSQVYPENVKFVKESFADATLEPFSYMLIDVTQRTPDCLRMRARIFPDDIPRNIIYIANKNKKS
jgi:hypothetical protein